MCNVMLVSVSECHFPSLDDLKSKQPPSTHPQKKPQNPNSHLFNINRYFRIKTSEHNKLYPCVSYGSVQGNIFATTEGFCAHPKELR